MPCSKPLVGCNPKIAKAKGVATLIILLIGTLVSTATVQTNPKVQSEPPQTPSYNEVFIPPPKIAFPRWETLEEREFYTRHRVAYRSSITSDFAKNDQVELEFTVPANRVGKVPIVILLHYWGASDNLLENSFAEELALKGIASVILPLPYHLSRTPEGYRSGQLTIRPNVNSLKNTTKQSVADIRRAIDFIETRPEFDPNRIGITGTSLGAVITSLAFAVEPRISSAAFIIGGADLAHIIWNSSRVVQQRDEFRRQGFTEDSLREALKEVEPLTYLSQSPSRPTYVINARYDSVIPTKSTDLLVQSLDSPQTLTLDTGHFGGILVQNRLVRTVTGFFDSTFKGSIFTAPNSFYAPTIRFGIEANPETDVQVLAGLDFWRLNSRGDAFASFLISPRGGRIFVGANLGGGVSLGAIILPRKTTAGLMWSIVF